MTWHRERESGWQDAALTGTDMFVVKGANRLPDRAPATGSR